MLRPLLCDLCCVPGLADSAPQQPAVSGRALHTMEASPLLWPEPGEGGRQLGKGGGGDRKCGSLTVGCGALAVGPGAAWAPVVKSEHRSRERDFQPRCPGCLSSSRVGAPHEGCENCPGDGQPPVMQRVFNGVTLKGHYVTL